MIKRLINKFGFWLLYRILVTKEYKHVNVGFELGTYVDVRDANGLIETGYVVWKKKSSIYILPVHARDK